MIHLTKALIRRWLDVLLHVADTPERTAAAFAMGVFFGFSPFLGFHTVLAIIVAFVFDLNRVAALLGVYSNLPWIIGPYYAIVTMFGAKLIGHTPPADFKAEFAGLFELSVFHGEFWHRLITMLKPLLWPYTIGSLLGAILMAAMAYPLALAFVTSRRRIREILHQHQR